MYVRLALIKRYQIASQLIIPAEILHFSIFQCIPQLSASELKRTKW